MLFRTIHDVALMLDRDNAGWEASPTGGVIDSETVKAPFVAPRGGTGGVTSAGNVPDDLLIVIYINVTCQPMSTCLGA